VAETECPREPGVRAEFAGAEQAFCRPSALKILKYNNIPGIFGLAGQKFLYPDRTLVYGYRFQARDISRFSKIP
jgi:hypothetical protein